MEIISLLLSGALAGWLAGVLLRGAGHGLVINIAVGIAGGIIGGKLFELFGLAHEGWLTGLAAAVAGALVLLILANLLRRPWRAAADGDPAG